ncbi:MAG: hypothetical protein PHG25_00605 [Candidatus Pacebacteria bacterium]|nr:hypothetical protein [Candidatus Paceibacterota bacterium]
MKILIGISEPRFDEQLVDELRSSDHQISIEQDISRIIYSLRHDHMRCRPDLTIICFNQKDLNELFQRVSANDTLPAVWIASEDIDSLSLLVGKYIRARRVIPVSCLRKKLQDEKILFGT